MVDSKFYMTYSRDRPNELIPWIEKHGVPILENAMHRWSYPTSSFMDMWEYDTEQVIDAGGYNVQSNYADAYGNVIADEKEVEDELSCESPFYPWDVGEYHTWLSNNSNTFDWATAMDYACEERFDPLWSVEDRIDATIDNTIEQFNKNPDYNLLPVLQGRSVDEYVYSYDTLKDHGIPVDTIGLGTICRLSSTDEIVRVENEVRERLDVDAIHGFGVKVDSFNRGAQFDTADSAAWVYGASNGRIYILNSTDGKLIKVEKNEESSLIRTVESFKTYYAYVTYLKSGESAVPTKPRLEFADEYATGGMDEDEFRNRWV